MLNVELFSLRCDFELLNYECFECGIMNFECWIVLASLRFWIKEWWISTNS